MSKRSASFQSAFEVLEEIKENVQICCAITMDPEEAECLIDELEDILIRMENLVTGKK